MKSSVRSEGAALLGEIGTPQFYIADRLKVSKSIVGMWITGDRHPSPKNQEAIEAAYNIPRLNWLLLEKPREQHASHARRTPGYHAREEHEGRETEPVRVPAFIPGESRLATYRRVVDAGLAALEGQPRISTRRALEIGRMLLDIQKLEGNDVREIHVLQHPKTIEILKIVRDAIAPHAECRRAFEEAMAAFDDRVPAAWSRTG